MRLVLDIGVNVAVNIVPRYCSILGVIAAEIIDACRRPPEGERMCVVAELLTAVEIVPDSRSALALASSSSVK